MEENTKLYKLCEKGVTNSTLIRDISLKETIGGIPSLCYKPVISVRNDSSLDYNLNLFISNERDDIINRALIYINPLYHKTANNVLRCNTRYSVYRCDSCDNNDKRSWKCQVRFCNCPECVSQRIAKAYHRLSNWNIKSQRLYHFTIGSRYMPKKQLEVHISEYMRRMRYGFASKSKSVYPHKEYKMSYVKVFDIGTQNTEEGLYFHYHIALIPEASFDVRMFMQDSKDVLKNINKDVIFNNIGYRTTKGILKYFSKRIAGLYGHKKTNYYNISDFFTFDQYMKTYYKAKVITYSFPVGLIYNIMPCLDGLLCSKCRTPLIFSHYENYDSNYQDTIDSGTSKDKILVPEL
jgi:hypothetical protein